MPSTPFHRWSAPHRWAGPAALAVCLLLPGCYDGDKLVEQARSRATRSRMEEVEIGYYRVTLPRNPETGETTEIEVRLFGESQRYKVKKLRKVIEARAPLIEDRTVSTLRQLTRKEMAEPELEAMRARLLATINDVLVEEPLDSIGFYDVRFVRH